jgi:hypothetical protein
LTAQTDGVAEVTDVAPLLLVDTTGVKDPPGVAEEGRFEMVGVSDPTARALELRATWKPTTATKQLNAITSALSDTPKRRGKK